MSAAIVKLLLFVAVDKLNYIHFQLNEDNSVRFATPSELLQSNDTTFHLARLHHALGGQIGTFCDLHWNEQKRPVNGQQNRDQATRLGVCVFNGVLEGGIPGGYSGGVFGGVLKRLQASKHNDFHFLSYYTHILLGTLA